METPESKFDFEAQFEHQLDPKIKGEILERAQIGKCGVDIFASAENAQEDRYISKELDAFTFDWAILSQLDPLWIYPPMECLENVVTKLVLDGAMGMLVTIDDLVTPQVQEILDQIAMFSKKMPQVEFGVQPNPPGP